MRTVAINGLGRIGRLVLRHFAAAPSSSVRIVAANDISDTEDLAYLLKYDSVHGIAPYEVSATDTGILVGSHTIQMFHESDPANLPWGDLGVDIVLECTGRYRRREDAAKHLQAGATKVIISAPSKSADITIIRGVNEEQYDSSRHHIISNASCTTNSLAPVVKVLQESFGIRHLLVTTVHAYTASQALVDRQARKRRRGRAAGISLVPTSTGAAKATELVLPGLAGHMDALAIRAPVPDGAITDLVAELQREVTVDEVNAALKGASDGPLKGILKYSEDDLVSVDIIGDPHSGIVDGGSTKVADGTMVKVLVWYDNEAGYAKKLLELAEVIASKEDQWQSMNVSPAVVSSR